MIKNILFDLDGTLFSFAECEKLALKSSFKVYGRKLEQKELDKYKEINSDLWKKFESGLITRNDVLQNRFKLFLKEINVDISPIQFSELYLYFLSGNFCLEFGALEVLLNLKEKYKLYVVTNGTEMVQMKKMTGANLINFFEAIFISENIGYNKPDVAFFDHCLSEIGCLPTECLIVGDSLSSDIQGGKNAGILTCWYNPERLFNELEIVPDYEIHVLTELNTILQQI